MIEIHRGVVHPWMCDDMGHLTTRFYIPMFDDGSRHFFAALGYTPDHLKAGLGFADVTTTQTYLSELGIGELVVVHGTVTKVGRTSVATRYTMTKLHDGTTAAEQTAVTVQFDLKARKAVPLIETVRDGAEALLAA